MRRRAGLRPMLPLLSSYAMRSLLARRLTTRATAAAIALLVFVLSASGMLVAGMRETVKRAGAPDRVLVLQHDTGAEQRSSFDRSILGRVAAAPGLAHDALGQPRVTGELVVQQMIGDFSAGRLSTVQFRGVDANVFDIRPAARIVAGRALRPGTAEAMVGRGVQGRYASVTLGGQLELSPGHDVTVVGVFESEGSMLESEIWVDLLAARTGFALEGRLSSATAVLADAADYEAFAETLTADKQVGLDVAREANYYEKLSGGMSDLIATLGVIEAAFFSLGAIIATTIVFYGAVTQRRREIGVLRALGFTRRSILAAFLVESLLLSLAGSAAGVAFALLTPLLDFTSVNFATGTDVRFHFRPDACALLGALGVAVGVGLIGGLLPAVSAARRPAVQALRA